MEKRTLRVATNSWLWQLLLWSPVLIATVACVSIGLPFAKYVLAQALVQKIAYDLAPSEYPGSKLVKQWEGGGPTTQWNRRTFQTTDTIDKVLAFMQSQPQAFVFREREHTNANSPFYDSQICNTSQPAIEATKSLVGRHYPYYDKDENLPMPCATILIYTDTNSPGLTFIEVWVDWPAD